MKKRIINIAISCSIIIFSLIINEITFYAHQDNAIDNIVQENFNNNYEIRKSNVPVEETMLIKDRVDDNNNIINEGESVSSLNGIASDIAQRRRKYLKSAKITDLRIDVAKAIENYYSFNGNYEQLKIQREQNENIKKEYENKVKQNAYFLIFKFQHITIKK